MMIPMERSPATLGNYNYIFPVLSDGDIYFHASIDHSYGSSPNTSSSGYAFYVNSGDNVLDYWYDADVTNSYGSPYSRYSYDAYRVYSSGSAGFALREHISMTTNAYHLTMALLDIIPLIIPTDALYISIDSITPS